PLAVDEDPGPPDGALFAASIRLGEPPFGVLQLFYADAPAEQELGGLAAFGARAAHALRAAERAHDVEVELERTRALLSVVGEAIARLSLAHTLETAVDRIGALLAIDQVGIYLRQDGRLLAAAGRGLTGGHEEVAHRLLELALGPLRARGTIGARQDDDDPAFAPVRAALAQMGAEAALAVPLHAGDEPI